MVKAIAHIALVATDLERAARFYTEVVGFREAMRLETTHSGTIVFLSLDGTQLELFGGGRPRDSRAEQGRTGYTHIALLVDDVEAEYERLRSRGVEFETPPTDAEAGIRLAFFRDPDGNRVEIIRFGEAGD